MEIRAVKLIRIKELIMMKKINAIKMQMQLSRPPKGNSLCKNTSYDVGVYIVKIGPPVFCTGHPFSFTQSLKYYALQCFSIGQTPQKCPFPWGHLHVIAAYNAIKKIII